MQGTILKKKTELERSLERSAAIRLSKDGVVEEAIRRSYELNSTWIWEEKFCNKWVGVKCIVD